MDSGSYSISSYPSTPERPGFYNILIHFTIQVDSGILLVSGILE